MKESSQKSNDQYMTPFLQSALDAMTPLLDSIDERIDSCFTLFASKVVKDGVPCNYTKHFHAGQAIEVSQILQDTMLQNKPTMNIVTRAFVRAYMQSVSKDDPDPLKRDLRMMLVRVYGTEEAKRALMPADETQMILQQITDAYPDRSIRINALTEHVKYYRKQGRQDIAQALHREASRLKEDIAADEQHTEELRIKAQQRTNQAREAIRVMRLRKEEAIEQQRLEHEYDHLTRRIRAYRTMIERLQAEMDAIAEEQRQLQLQHPQFDPHSAAKRKRQQLAERKRERARSKKKGKEGVIDNVGSCSQILRKVV